jgi:hypothetical protein
MHLQHITQLCRDIACVIIAKTNPGELILTSRNVHLLPLPPDTVDLRVMEEEERLCCMNAVLVRRLD